MAKVRYIEHAYRVALCDTVFGLFSHLVALRKKAPHGNVQI